MLSPKLLQLLRDWWRVDRPNRDQRLSELGKMTFFWGRKATLKVRRIGALADNTVELLSDVPTHFSTSRKSSVLADR